MKVVLINPYLQGSNFNLGLHYIAEYLKMHQIEVMVIYFNSKKYFKKNMENIIRYKPDIVGISVNLFLLKSALEIAAYLKSEINPFIVVGGPEVTIKGRLFLEKYKVFDCACVGESEITFHEFVVNFHNPENFINIKGIIFRNKEEIIENPRRELVKNIDSLPFPEPGMLKQHSVQSLYPVITSRGCCYNCIFCPNALIWEHKWRHRSVNNVLDELEAVAARGYKSVAIYDDNFNFDIERAKDILRGMKERNIKLWISFANGIRIDRIDEELISLIKENGCSRIAFGLENIDPQTMEYVNKVLSVDKVKEGVRLIRKYGFRPEAFMILGLIQSDRHSIMRSIKTLKSLKIDLARWYIAIPVYGTKLYEWIKENGKLLDEADLENGTWSATPPIMFENVYFDKKKLLKMFYYANSEMNNYYFLCHINNHFWVMKFFLGIKNILMCNPKKLFNFIFWFIKASVNPGKYIFNEVIPEYLNFRKIDDNVDAVQ